MTDIAQDIEGTDQAEEGTPSHPREGWSDLEVNEALRRAQARAARLSFVNDKTKLRAKLAEVESNWREDAATAEKDVQEWRENLRAVFLGEPMPHPDANDRTRNTSKGNGSE